MWSSLTISVSLASNAGRALAMSGVDADSETVLAGLPDADAP